MTMNDSVIEDYLLWLMPQIREGGAYEEYEPLLRLMMDKEFAWLIPNDDNRVADGLDLRADFCHERNIDPEPLKRCGPASFLEVLIALSKRLSFITNSSAESWAWHLMINLGLDKMKGQLSRTKVKRVEDIMDTCIWRTYTPDGVGGFFPLSWSETDQTKVEIWYQMAAYIDELSPEQT